MAWIDAHCHLADPRLEKTLDAVIRRSRAAHVTGWLQGGVSPEDWDRQLQIRARFGEGILPVFGLHPWWVAKNDEKATEKALALLEKRLGEAVALGELGLDHHPKHATPESHGPQQRAFEAQLALGKKAGKPLVLHVVQAHDAALKLLESAAPFPSGGLVHAFSGPLETARRYLDLGFHLSLCGTVTREGYRALKTALPSLPSDRLVVETDAPDQAPRVGREALGGLNEPAYLPAIAAAIGSLRGSRGEVMLEASTRNLKRLLRMNG